MALGLALIAPAARAAASTSDPAMAAGHGAAWIASQLGARGALSSPTGAGPDLNATAYALLALASTGTGGTAAATAVDHLKAHVDEYVVVEGADAPGPLATLILAARAVGLDPRTAFGSDLVDRLRATRQPSGLFGIADPTIDGAYRQGLALAALGAIGIDEPAGVDWLRDQQCDDGGWVARRTDTSAPCPPPDPASFTGEDSNSTAMAVMGLAAQDAAPVHDAVAWFDRTQGADGGWAYVAAPDQASDANSTALAIMGLRALGTDVRSARFTTATDPLTLLVSFQLGCDRGAEAGAFAYQPVRGVLTANALATVQAVPALAGTALPLAAPPGGLAPGTAVPCPAGAIAATGSSDALYALLGVGAALVLAGLALLVAPFSDELP